MTPPRQRSGSGGAARAPQIQDRPAAPATKKEPKAVLDPSNRDGEFPPNPVPPKKASGPQAEEYDLRVVGPKEVGGVKAPGKVTMTLTQGQLDALLFGGHVEAWTEDEGGSPDEEGN